MDLAEQLRNIGIENISSSPSQMYCYCTDASQIRGMPECVVRPQNTEQVSDIVKFANDNGIPLVARGAGTGMAGGAVAIKGGIVLDMSGMDRIISVEVENLQVLVEPGVVHSKLNEVLKPHGFFFPPDPGSSEMCTLGGLIGNNGSGMRSVKYGTTRHYVLDLEVVMADGSIIHTGSKTLKSITGYDLTGLMVGSEGTLGIITKALLKIHPLPKARSVMLASFETAEMAGEAVVRTLASGIVPSACEILDSTTIQALKSYDPQLDLSNAGAILLFEVDGTSGAVREGIETIKEVCSSLSFHTKAAEDTAEAERIWSARRMVGAAISRIDPKRTRVYVGEDIGVPIKEIPVMLSHIHKISEESGIPIMIYGHIGDGNLHTGMAIDLLDSAQMETVNKIADRIHRTAIMLGGTVSAEHGIGAARAEYVRMEKGNALDVMSAIKKALDPKGILNPGKMGV
ncbi:FAD linked oxidase domain protein [Methanosalsum zhilinae DSM 4017]|uniref:FAD linked oxidase domain protein n=1 Tax=Methanosalsum zhilinae (strain DSM 4017 / NBRC 107636 / OCM 62 / WeN5) TaxID=679901 RepID=F7XMI8_METZD|nr:FAD-binding oxidoreductase [Methanosalsum zhilinae]AEH59911.1 FAD linked oxidase domain protein [Methanosalsum zhilinae DSM 4017]